MTKYLENYKKWLDSDKLADEEKKELLSIKDDENEIIDRFDRSLTFGTAGLRGKMKLGTNAINKYTVAVATQGLAKLIIKQNRQNDGVFVCYDCRNNSEFFAKTTASVLAGNGIKVYFFDELRPTPVLSFAIREKHCVAGINITASHNPKEYNGYKAYWEDGAQLPPEHAQTVFDEISKLDIFNDVQSIDFDEAVNNGKIEIIGSEIDEKYLENVMAQSVKKDAVKNVADNLNIVYTPLHGTGYRLVPDLLQRIGVEHLYVVPEQMEVDGNFPTVVKPNPEYSQAFDLGIEIAKEVNSNIVIATDPDADRVGVVIKNNEGKFITITGNQMGALLLDYIITAYNETGTMPKNPYVVKTIVTTELATRICEANNVKIFNVLTGFKFIGEVIKNFEKSGEEANFLLGFEESYGYLKGTYARDKDSLVATMLITEMTAYYQSKGMTLFDVLQAIYKKYGFYLELTAELYMQGSKGIKRMAELMDKFRNNTPKSIAGKKLVVFGDYKKQTIKNLETGEEISTNLPSSNVIKFTLENKDVIIVRPSGTEPKIKFYYLLSGVNKDAVEENLKKYEEFIATYID